MSDQKVIQKKESVSVSFHYLILEKKDENDEMQEIGFTQSDFDQLINNIENRPIFDLDNIDDREKFLRKAEVPIEHVDRLDGRTISGIFYSSYSGHEYENSVKGTIPAASINKRKFCFLLYLSESGRIYISSQYLGPYGGYTGLKNTLVLHLRGKGSVKSRSFRLDNFDIDSLAAREIMVNISKSGKYSHNNNVMTRNSAIILRRSPDDDEFEDEVRRKIFPFLSKRTRKGEMKKQIKKILADGGLIDASDTEIEDCFLIALSNGNRRKIYLLEGAGFASKFVIEVMYHDNGHPRRHEVVDQMRQLLEDEIISRSEDV